MEAGPSSRNPPPDKANALCYALASLAGSRGGLVDLLVARGGVNRAHRDRGANILELKVISRRSVLDEVDLALRVAGVARTLDAHTLVRVGTAAGNVERLIQVATLGVLLALLADLRHGRNHRDDQHRQHRRQQHQLLQLLPPS